MVAGMPLSFDSCQKSFWRLSSGSGKAILKWNWREHSGFNDKIALCFRKSIMKPCIIFSPNDKAVILIKSMWHPIRQWNRMQKKQSGKVIQGHFSIKEEKGIAWITAWRGRAWEHTHSFRKLGPGGDYGLEIINQSSGSTWANCQVSPQAENWMDHFTSCNGKYRWQGQKRVWGEGGFQRQRAFRILSQIALKSQNYKGILWYFDNIC